jgi:hypothetical protein
MYTHTHTHTHTHNIAFIIYLVSTSVALNTLSLWQP